MFNILTLNDISKKIYDVLGNDYIVSNKNENPDAILVRSFKMHDYPINDNLLAVARAGAGVNNIPIEELSDKGIVVFNTPGANANGVKELVICGMLMASRNIEKAVKWIESLQDKGDAIPALVEKGKKPFVGTELYGKTLGIVGLGAIGAKVANSCSDLGMNIMGYDPYLTENAINMLKCSVNFVTNLNTLYRNCDIISFHVPLLDSTRGMINKESISFMKNNVILINMSRAELAIVEDISDAIKSTKIHKYVVDFPTSESINQEGIISIPHLGASTEESEDNCAVMAASQIKDYLENGNINNSVNFPTLNVVRTTDTRLSISYNVGSPAIKAIISLLAGSPLIYAEKGSIGYAIADLNSCDNLDLENFADIDGIFMIRIL